MKTHHVTSGIIRQKDTILLIQQGADGETPYWFIPGGVIEQGEMITDALKREIQEETGLIIIGDPYLVYTTQVVSQTHQTIAFIFEMMHFTGELRANDPDKLIHKVQWMPITDAIRHLNHVPWLSMKQPLLTYLKGDPTYNPLWQYQQHGEFDYTLVGQLPIE